MNEKKLTDNSIRSETVKTTTVITKTETEEILSDKISDIQEGVYTVEQLFDLNINLKWTINNILPVGGLMILSGSHGLGKSFMSLDLAIKMSQESSELWLNKFKLQSGPVAYIDTENGLSLVKHRLQLLGAKKEDELKIIYRRSLDINNSSDYSQLSKDLKKINPVLIIIDSLRRCHTANENDAGKMSQVMNQIQNLHPAAKIVLHHTCKNGSGLRGSGDLSAVVDSHLQLTKTEHYRSVFTHAKSRWAKAVDDFTVNWIEEPNSLKFVYGGTSGAEELCDKSKKIIQVIRDAGGMLSKSEIVRRSGISERTIQRRIPPLIKKGILLPEKKGRSMYYSLIDNQEKNGGS